MTAFSLADEQVAIRDMARDFANERIAPFALEWDRECTFPVETLRTAAGLGMGGIYVGEAFGGSGLSRLDAALIFEALATGCPTVAAFLSIHNMATWMIDRFGSPALRETWVPSLCRMDAIAAYALTEPGSGSDAAALTTRAVREGEDYRIDGAKQFISGAGVAHAYVAMVRTGEAGPRGISTVLVPADAPGLSFGKVERKMGWNAQPTRAVIFDGCRVPVANRLGAEGEGFRIAMSGLDGGRLNIAACSLGGATDALERSLLYLRERRAFGQPLDSYQALQFRVADMATELEVARSILWRAAASLDAGEAQATMLCAMAKRFVTDAGFAVANEALQLHGGYGYLHDTGIEKIVRDLRVHQILEGTNEIMRVIVARRLLENRL
ncbi:acyl-CoA dehydrogenase family protein [Aureimonas pseudogalii]|uniref:Acyl-CoA dehydrogenase n=1 Tax=Aureimonas pseudogalii TaxID=1744844 RepID=A0A7W6H3T4_9HYPH|nr:acyl-CoA dehydrogenase family protein [Aureimonas pseudogalii]MBB3998060.1 hypothetical protein [Aureimonas pseudogalii]